MGDDLQAVIFDWGGVCCSEGEPFASRALQERLRLTPDEITERARDIYTRYYTGDYDRDAFWRAIMERFELREEADINPIALSRAYLASYAIYEDVLDFILSLRKTYRTGLLSNLTPEMRAHIRARHDLGRYFDAQVYSCDPDVKARKPDAKMFQTVLQRLRVPPTQCLFIDNTKQYVDAAIALGMRGIFFRNREQFFEEIKRFV